MASVWSNSIPRSKKLDEGIQLLKSVPPESFEFILRKIKQKDMFNDDDINNLMEKFKVDDKDTRHIIETISYINKHMSKIILKPADLENVLIKDFKIDEEIARLWIRFWTEDISQNFDLENLDKLENVSWTLNLQAGSTLFRKEWVPTATIQLKGTHDDTIFRLEEEELVYLYKTLENIQAKLDM